MRVINSGFTMFKMGAGVMGRDGNGNFLSLRSIFKYFINDSPLRRTRSGPLCNLFLSEFYSWLQALGCFIHLVPFFLS